MSRSTSPHHNTLSLSMLFSMPASERCSWQHSSLCSSKAGYANSTAAYRRCLSQSSERRPVNSGSSGWSTGSSQRWLGCYHCSSRYPFFYFSSVSSCFFFTSVHPRLVSPQRFLALESSIMPSPRPYLCLLPPHPSALLFRALWSRCTEARMLISLQRFVISKFQRGILRQQQRWVVCTALSRSSFRHRAHISRKTLKSRLQKQQRTKYSFPRK